MPNSSYKHYGFAQVPRLVTRGRLKEQLSLAEKGLYLCLKDICGDEGECFYTLENLAEEIGTSASTLSRHIPKLHEAKIIIAEKKPTTKNKHEIWHIRMVDLWKENDKTYAPAQAQDDFKMKTSSQNPQNQVQDDFKMKALSVKMKSSGREKEPAQAQDDFKMLAIIRSNTLEEESKNERVISPSHSERAKAILTLCAQEIGIQIAKTPYVWEQAEMLASEDVAATDDSLRLVISRMKKSKYWIDKGGITFENVASNYGREWAIIQQQQRKPHETHSEPPGALSSQEKNQRNIERALAKLTQQEKGCSHAQPSNNH